MSEDQKTALQLEREQMEKDAAAENATRNGVGLRVMVGATRGKNTSNIKYEAFDESQPDTLPADVAAFVKLTGIDKNADLVELLITGFNDKAYTEASDPIAEHVGKAWDKDTILGFRSVVRGLVKINGMTIEEAVNLVKPGTEKKFLASQSK